MAGIAPSASNLKSSASDGQNYTGAMTVLTTLFFIWAFVTNLNDILIPHLKKACDLTDFQSSLVQSAFFGAYFIMSIPSGAILKKTGYKVGIIIGLLGMFIGAVMFVPAAITRMYPLFLAALFIMASGVTLLQVAANAYVSVLGPAETASSRLNLTQAFNSLGASVAPYLGGLFILSGVEKSLEQISALSPEQLESWRSEEASAVIMPYLVIAGVVVLIMVLIWFSKLPQIDAELESDSAETETAPKNSKTSAWGYSHLVWGVIAIFFYVGAEVAIGSFLIKFAGMESILGYDEKTASKFPSIYMFLAMCGRFLGSYILTFLKPAKIVAFNALAAFVLLFLSAAFQGPIALYCAVAVGFFNSIMFPTIFTLGIKDLGIYTKQGSSLLIMAIVGGAIIPPVMGLVSDMSNIQWAFLVPAVCYLPILYFGAIGAKVKA